MSIPMMNPFKKIMYIGSYLVFYFLDLILFFWLIYSVYPNLLLQILLSLGGLAWCIYIATYKKNWLDVLFQVTH
jgi:hypothetical protein